MNAFLYSSVAKKYFTNQATGSGQRYGLTVNSIADLKIPFFELNTQKLIGNFFSYIDRKISNNNKIISKLESIAKTIYDYWFVQFDFPNDDNKPYKKSGGEMVYSKELGRYIPKDWEVITLNKLLNKNFRPFDYSSVQPTIDLSVMPTLSIGLNQINISSNFTTNLFQMKEGDILFGSIRPYLKKVGIAPCNGVHTGTIYSYTPKKETDYNFCLITMCREIFFDYAMNVSQGTRMPVVKSENLLNYRIAYNSKISEKFNNLEIKGIICNKIKENQKLAEIRDFLLPLLMNGQAYIE